MTQISPSAHLVWVLYDPRRLHKGRELIEQISRLTALDRLVIVWNGKGSLPFEVSSLRSLCCSLEVVIGSNCGREFGGYQEGLNHLDHKAAGGVYFLNDTAGLHNYLPHYFVRALVSAAAKRWGDHGVCIGHIDRSSQILEIKNLTSNSWVRSNIFYLDSVALDLLDWTIYSSEVDALIIGDCPGRFYDAELSSSMQQRINQWIFTPSRRSWYGAAPLSITNANLMAGKARSILQEYFFSMRVVHAKIQISRTDMTNTQLLLFKIFNRLGRELGYLK